MLSCIDPFPVKKPVVPQDKEDTQDTIQPYDAYEGMTQLGKKLKNPYSVAIMRRVYDQLMQSDYDELKEALKDIKIYTSHLYIKFNPTNEADLEILANDSTLVLFTFPLDYEIKKMGYYYHDPSVPTSQPTPLYCAVPASYDLPSVAHETLAELFLPRELADEGGMDQDVADAIAYTAEKITGNVDAEDSQTTTPKKPTPISQARTADFWDTLFGYKWKPAGRVRVWSDEEPTQIPKYVQTGTRRVCEEDPIHGKRWGDMLCRTENTYRKEWIPGTGDYVPVVGVEVRVYQWFHIRTCFTNASGYYSLTHSLRGTVRYSIHWARYQFSIRIGEFVRAELLGPDCSSSWHVNIRGYRQEYYATIFRAAHYYYYEPIRGLRRPPTNAWNKPQMKIGAFYESKSGQLGHFCAPCLALGFLSRIRIYSPHKSSESKYSTVIHELAHAAHWDIRKRYWNNGRTESKVEESWATGVEWALTRIKYPAYKPRYSKNYTGVVQDMIDADGIIARDANRIENVTGYTITQLENVLYNTSTWNEWENNIRNTYQNETENELVILFNHPY